MEDYEWLQCKSTYDDSTLLVEASLFSRIGSGLVHYLQQFGQRCAVRNTFHFTLFKNDDGKNSFVLKIIPVVEIVWIYLH